MLGIEGGGDCEEMEPAPVKCVARGAPICEPDAGLIEKMEIVILTFILTLGFISGKPSETPYLSGF
jgi:hypothetical protein